jgi:hypothetical protein
MTTDTNTQLFSLSTQNNIKPTKARRKERFVILLHINTSPHGNRVTALLCNVDELISREVGHLIKMESTGVGIPHQAGC